jgi:hypothetical protein
MEHVSIFYGYLVNFTSIWSILLPFDVLYFHLMYFTSIWYVYFVCIWYILWAFGKNFPFWYVEPRKIWQLWNALTKRCYKERKNTRNGANATSRDPFYKTRLWPKSFWTNINPWISSRNSRQMSHKMIILDYFLGFMVENGQERQYLYTLRHSIFI